MISHNKKHKKERIYIMKRLSFILAIVIFTMTACSGNTGSTSSDDNKVSIDPISQKMIDDIDSIGEVTLEDENLISKLTERYTSLTDAQKSQVTNYAMLLTASDELERLIKEDNKPIELTTSNAEDYLNINVYSDNVKESVKNSLGWKDYVYDYTVTADVSPLKSYYFENVSLSIKWTLNSDDLYATYNVTLDDTGKGSFTHDQHFQSAIGLDYWLWFSVKDYEITKISGNVYKIKPEN